MPYEISYETEGTAVIDKTLASNLLPTNVQLSNNGLGSGKNFYVTSDDYTVFEFVAMDISQNFIETPSFIPVIDGAQFTDVSAIAIINASAINFSRLFKFKTDDVIIENGELSDWEDRDLKFNNMNFGCGSIDVFKNSVVKYSNASVTVGLANKAGSFVNKTSIKQDFVRHLAKSITGGYAMSEIFTNEEELFKGVVTMDASFNVSMNAILSNSSTNSVGFGSSTGLYAGENIKNDPVALSCQNLVANLFQLNVSVKANGDTNGNAVTLARGQQFLNDLSNQASTDIAEKGYYVMFRDKDVLAVKLNYMPKNNVNGVDDGGNGSAPGSNPIYTRSYKVYIVMDDDPNNKYLVTPIS